MNCMCATGNLGADCRTNTVNGTAVANFSLAVKAGFGDYEQTVWLDCALWGKRAEGKLTEYLVKGQAVAVSGELGFREYQDRNGNDRTAFTLRVGDLTLIGGKDDGKTQAGDAEPVTEEQPTGEHTPPADDLDDSIPF